MKINYGTDKKLEQLVEQQDAEKELARIEYLLLHYKFAPGEKQLVEVLRDRTKEKILEIKRKNLVEKGDCLSCRMMNF
ncbi:hypothetical protein IKA92_01985 [bacterium]|nr:hypothetical protein [bacterium]